ADLRCLADYDAHAVVDEDPAPHLGGGVNLDAGQEARQGRDEPGRRRPAAAPEPVGHAVKGQRMHARVRDEHLEARAGGRIPLPHGGGVAAYRVEHQASPPRRRSASSAAARRAPATTSAACLRSSGSPSTASSTSWGFRFSSSSTVRPTTFSLTALAAAMVGPQPYVWNRASLTRPSRTRRKNRA